MAQISGIGRVVKRANRIAAVASAIWFCRAMPGWADSWDLDLAVAARRSGINGCRYASDDGFDARPACFTEHDDSDSAIREVLLLPEVRVGGEQHLEATGLRSQEQFPVAQRRPALFEKRAPTPEPERSGPHGEVRPGPALG